MMPQQLDNDQMKRLFEHRMHEDTMFNNRLSFFLVFESVLLGVVGVLSSRPSPVKLLLISIVCLGLLLTILWGYIQARQKYILDSLNALSREMILEYQMA